MSNEIICREIRQVRGGWILELPWPYGGQPDGFGEVICAAWPDVILKLSKVSGEFAKAAAEKADA